MTNLNIKHFDKCAKIFDGAPHDVLKDIQYNQELIRILDNFNHTSFKNCLEVGFGTGLMAIQLEDRGWIYTGIDGSANMLNEAKEKGVSDDKLHLVDLSTAPLPAMGDEKFSAVISFATLGYINDPCKVIKQMLGRLEPGGVAIFDLATIKSDKDRGIVRTNSSIGGISNPDPKPRFRKDLDFFIPTSAYLESTLRDGLGDEWSKHVEIKKNSSQAFQIAKSGKVIKPDAITCIVSKPR